MINSIIPYLDHYRTTPTGAVGLNFHPQGKDCDNHLLFTATAYIVFGALLPSEWTNIISLFRRKPGFFVRYPGEETSTSWDDLLGVSVADPDYAREILQHAYMHDWAWSNNWLGRIPLLVPTVMAGAGVKLSLWNKLRAASCYLHDALTDGGTSGVCLLYLASHVLYEQGWLLKVSIEFWKWRKMKRYPGGMKEVYTIYFKAHHPFATYAHEDFEIHRAPAKLGVAN